MIGKQHFYEVEVQEALTKGKRNSEAVRRSWAQRQGGHKTDPGA
jgi:hypothetical protein